MDGYVIQLSKLIVVIYLHSCIKKTETSINSKVQSFSIQSSIPFFVKETLVLLRHQKDNYSHERTIVWDVSEMFTRKTVGICKHLLQKCDNHFDYDNHMRLGRISYYLDVCQTPWYGMYMWYCFIVFKKAFKATYVYVILTPSVGCQGINCCFWIFEPLAFSHTGAILWNLPLWGIRGEIDVMQEGHF